MEPIEKYMLLDRKQILYASVYFLFVILDLFEWKL